MFALSRSVLADEQEQLFREEQCFFSGHLMFFRWQIGTVCLLLLYIVRVKQQFGLVKTNNGNNRPFTDRIVSISHGQLIVA